MPVPHWDGQIRICGCAVGSYILCMISTLNCTFHIISQHTLLYHMLSTELLLSSLFLLSQETCCSLIFVTHCCHIGCKGFESQKILVIECTFNVWLQNLMSASSAAFFSLIHYVGSAWPQNYCFYLSLDCPFKEQCCSKLKSQ